MASSSAAAASLLGRQLKEMQTGKDIPGISCGLVNDNSIFEWEVMLMISDDCKYYGGMLSFFLLLKVDSACRSLPRWLPPSPLQPSSFPSHPQPLPARNS